MRTEPSQALAALAASAGVGGLATAIGLVLAMVGQSFTYGLPSFAEIMTGGMMALAMVLMLGVYTTIVFAVGLLFVGLPAWAILYQLGVRSRAAATLTGGLLTGTTTAALAFALDRSSPGGGWFGLLMVLPGVAAGWTLHRVAYGRAELPSA